MDGGGQARLRGEGEEEDEEDADVIGADGEVGPSATQAATLGNVASGLAEQLSSITQEMNKIREELYGDGGIGGIAKELDRLKAGGLSGLLDGANSLDGLGDLSGALDGAGAGAGAASSGARARAPRSSGSAASAAAGGEARAADAGRQAAPLGARAAGGEPAAGPQGARSKLSPEERREREELIRKRLAARSAKDVKASTLGSALMEKLVMLLLVIVCLYFGSPFFRTAVTKAFGALVLGQDVSEGWDDVLGGPGSSGGVPDDGEIVADL